MRRRKAILGAWVLEDAEVDALLLRLYRPGYRVMFGYLNPAYYIALFRAPVLAL